MKYLNFDFCLKYFIILGLEMNWIMFNFFLLVCDFWRLIDFVLLCYYFKDEQKVIKFKYSFQEFGLVIVIFKDEGLVVEGGGGFSEDLVIFCFFVEYVQSFEQFVRGKFCIDRDLCICFVCLFFCNDFL